MQKIVIAVTGASGAVYAKVLLDKLIKMTNQIAHLGLVMSNNAKDVWKHELGNSDYEAYSQSKEGFLTVTQYDKYDFTAPFASGSGQYTTMLVVPCSMGTLGRVANGISDDLVTRTADVILKERRKLILAVRETPYNLIHLKNMEAVTLAGAIVCPATPSFYSLPNTIEEVAATVVDRMIDLAGLKQDSYRWGNQ
jgi:4-hydroxy-3-polyprenylbenzoate decarboxylase